MTRVKNEINRRRTRTDAVLDLFRSRPLQWIGVHELAQVGGFAAWRSRVAEARGMIEAGGGSLTWNKQVQDSAYMFTPYTPLGRDAAERVEQKSLPGLG